jgi:hypothetical protein
VVVFDATFLMVALVPNAKVPADPKTNRPIENASKRVEYLIDTLSDTRTPIIIPTPALAECFVITGGSAAAQLHTALRNIPSMRVTDFDLRAAIECASLTSAALARGRKRGSASNQPYQKVKIDRQIVAIAKVAGARTIYTGDGGLADLAKDEGLLTQHFGDLLMPPMAAQGSLFVET